MDIITLDHIGVSILSSVLLSTPQSNTVDISELACRISALTYESIGEGDVGQYAVSNVITRRSINRKSTTCEVVTARKQFSYLNEKYPDLLVIDDQPTVNAFTNVVDTALKDELGLLDDITFCADHYLNPKTILDSGNDLPTWYNRDKIVFKYGGHEFLKLNKRGC